MKAYVEALLGIAGMLSIVFISGAAVGLFILGIKLIAGLVP